MANRLNIDVVKKAIDAIIAEGRCPTNKNIVNYLGYGSYSTLTILRKSHPNVFGVSPKRINTNTVQNTVDNSLWTRIDKRFNEMQTVLDTKYSTVSTVDVINAEKKILNLEMQIKDLKALLDDKESHDVIRINELEKERLELQEIIEDLKDEKEAMQGEQSHLIQENERLKSKIESIQGEAQANIDSLTQKLNEATQENERLAGDYNKLHKNTLN